MANLVTINIAPHTAQGFKLAQFIGHFQRSPIATVPHFVAIGKMFEHPLIQHAVRIRQHSYSRHLFLLILNEGQKYKKQNTTGSIASPVFAEQAGLIKQNESH
jgi:hypothetical protein